MNDSPPVRVPLRRRGPNANRVFLPRELRDAIPEQHRGRDLVLDSITAGTGNSIFLGPQVGLNLLIKETGKLSGEFTISVFMEPQAARALAATLQELADQAEQRRAG
jgi:hypothetical protein